MHTVAIATRRLRALGLLLAGACSLALACGTDGDKGSATSQAGASGNSGASAGGAGGLASNAGSGGKGGSTGGVAGSSAGSSGASGTAGSAGTSTGPGDKPFDWVGVIGTGQSLSVGWESSAISTTQPFANIKLEDQGPDPKYPINGAASAVWTVIPLTEPFRRAVAGTGLGYDDWQYPNNIGHYEENYGETPHTGMGNTLSAIWQARGGEGDYITAHSVVGWSGHPIGDIDKQGGDRSFIAALAEVTAFKALAEAEGKTYGVGGIILTHGEADATNPTYGASVYQMWQDYNTDIKAITGQTRDVVLLASQQSASVSYGGSQTQIWKGGVDHPGQIVCTGPKYQYRPYGLHFPGGGYERLGEKYAEVFDLIVNQGVDWKPVGPNNITRAGAVVTITFDVPNPPLQWDENLVMPHQAAHTAWANGRGFEVKDSSNNEIAIASVEIVGDDTVVLTLAADPGSTSLTLGYAITQDSPDAYQGGADGGPHGQLRDSDEFVGYDVETVAANVTNGSANISAVTSGTFARRTGRDVVTGSGLADGTTVLSPNYDSMTLSDAWTGATGTADLTFRHDHANYCVHFDMAIP